MVSPCLTFLLFEVILRTTYAANRYLKEPILCDDDVLTFLLSRFPRTESNINPEEIYYTSNDVIDICISICNEQTRQQLAYLFPTRFLLDPSTIVFWSCTLPSYLRYVKPLLLVSPTIHKLSCKMPSLSMMGIYDCYSSYQLVL